MDAVLSQQFSADWARVAMKQRFVALIGRSDKDRLAGDSLELQAGALPCKSYKIVLQIHFHCVPAARVNRT